MHKVFRICISIPPVWCRPLPLWVSRLCECESQYTFSKTLWNWKLLFVVTTSQNYEEFKKSVKLIKNPFLIYSCKYTSPQYMGNKIAFYSAGIMMDSIISYFIMKQHIIVVPSWQKSDKNLVNYVNNLIVYISSF